MADAPTLPETGFSATTLISSSKIADQFVTAIEGGSAYWCDRLQLISSGDVAPDNTHKGPWYDNEQLYNDPALLLRATVEDTDHDITRADIQKGLAILAEKYAWRLAEIVDEDGDAETADVFLQCVVFGEIVYG